MAQDKPGFEKWREKKAKDLNNVLAAFTKQCIYCQKSSGKAILFEIKEGLICSTCAGYELGLSVAQLMEKNEEHMRHMEAERNKPKPKNFGEWA
jgi:hypothetical protein